MLYEDKILIGKANDKEVYIFPEMANRHGLIAGATGTGKTVTLKVLAESFSELGVPVFLADAKGDLAGLSYLGEMSDNIKNRVDKLGLEKYGFCLDSFPVTFWDVYQEKGIPLRTTVSEMGPMLLSRILELNNLQSDILNIVFKIADDEKLLLIDCKDLKAMLLHIADNADKYSLSYGNMSKQSIAAIIRAIVSLEASGGETFFAEPAIDINDWFSQDENGKGWIQVLDSQKLMLNPKLYATFLLWLISEIYESLPEAGDLDKPKMVFFFDEAHMLFDDAPKVLIDKVSQMVKLIRSKGVGIYFITQSPNDIPDEVLAQLSNKVIHAIRAYTPKEQKTVRAVAESFRANSEFDISETISNLGIGEALVSVLDRDGIPTIVEKTKILPPRSMMGAINDEARNEVIVSDELNTKYATYVDNESAYEFMARLKTRESLNPSGTTIDNNQNEKRNVNNTPTIRRSRSTSTRTTNPRPKEYKPTSTTKRRTSSNYNRTLQSSASKIGRQVGKSIGDSIGGSFGKKLGGDIGSSLARGIFDTFLRR